MEMVDDLRPAVMANVFGLAGPTGPWCESNAAGSVK
jgi:hypothetical protein